jgi:hypothetical protein
MHVNASLKNNSTVRQLAPHHADCGTIAMDENYFQIQEMDVADIHPTSLKKL